MLKNFTSYLLLGFLFITTDSNATHIVGGDLTYDFLYYSNNNTQARLKVRLNLYRDTSPSSSSLATDVLLGVYRENDDGTWSYVQAVRAYRSPIQPIPYVDNPCREEPTDVVGVETAFYETDITLDLIDGNYMIAHQRCCRNYYINNIQSYQTGAAYDIIITPEALRVANNSVEFKKYPPIFICSNLPLAEDVSGVDVDGDSLSYSFCRPLKAGGPYDSGGPCFKPKPEPAVCLPPFDVVTYVPPYTYDKPMRGDPLVRIDEFTGFMTGQPEYIGQYVIGMCIKEYRGGKLLNIVRRDFQFNAIECGEELHAILAAEDTYRDPDFPTTNPIYEIIVCGSDKATIVSNSTGGTVIYNHNWKIHDPAGNVILEEAGPTLDRVALELPEYGIYSGELLLNNGLDCPDSAYFKIYKNKDLDCDFTFDMDTCNIASVGFEDLSTTNNTEFTGWQWDFNGEGTSDQQHPFFLFDDKGPKEVTLIVTDDKRCEDTLVTIVDYNPFGDDFIPEDFYQEEICYGDSILFGDKWIIEEGTYRDRILDDATGCVVEDRILFVSYSRVPETVYHSEKICKGSSFDFKGEVYTDKGTYELHTKEINGECDSLIDYITIEYHSDLDVNFEFTASQECYLGSILFEDLSANADPNIKRTWNFGNGEESDQKNYEVHYDSRGTYLVTLTIEDDNCTYEYNQEVFYDPPFDSLTVKNIDKIICPTDSTLIGGKYESEPGAYTEIFQFANSDCDSATNFITLSLHDAPRFDTIYEVICPGDYFSFDNVDYSNKGIYDHLAISTFGCDSLFRTIVLDHHEVPEISFDETSLLFPEFVPKEIPVSYYGTLDSVLWTPADGLSCDTCLYPIVDYDYETNYKVSVKSEDGCTAENSITIDFIEVPYYIPNVLNKRADNIINRFFLVQKPEYALKTPYYDLVVYDRWGSPVFSEEDIRINETADAFNAYKMGSGVFIYAITIKEPRETKTFSGTFTVIE